MQVDLVQTLISFSVLPFANLRFKRIVLINHFDWQSSHLAAKWSSASLKGIAHVVADGCRRPAKRADKSHLDSFGAECRGAAINANASRMEFLGFRHRTLPLISRAVLDVQRLPSGLTCLTKPLLLYTSERCPFRLRQRLQLVV